MKRKTLPIPERRKGDTIAPTRPGKEKMVRQATRKKRKKKMALPRGKQGNGNSDPFLTVESSNADNRLGGEVEPRGGKGTWP